MNKQLGSKIEKSKTPTLQKHLLGHGISFINSKYDKSYFISACQDDEPDIDYYRRIIELDKNKRSVKEISKTRITYEEEKKNKMVEIAKTKKFNNDEKANTASLAPKIDSSARCMFMYKRPGTKNMFGKTNTSIVTLFPTPPAKFVPKDKEKAIAHFREKCQASTDSHDCKSLKKQNPFVFMAGYKLRNGI
ncbi:unnamed protein product [Moneuplotes crassus]|uniref:Uncharacterized protein n=1 Tax=Euplotes crassus TaxID=5936 RepID=A0AAD1Y8H4_EUPCR|nr:unnamed protein product [Moneuplotes crassus]